MASVERRRKRTAYSAVVAFAVAFTGLQLWSLQQKSATWDEPIHLTAGFAALAEGDYRIDPTHPPFLRVWAALPLLAMRGLTVNTSEIDRTPILEWLPKGYSFAHQFLYKDHDADRLLYAARFMVVILGLLLGFLLFSWAREWLGTVPAVAVTAFYVLEPNIAAHSTLVTTDFGITCFVFGTVYFLWRTCRYPRFWNTAALTLFFSLAVITKFSGLLLGPIVLLLAIVGVALKTGISLRQSVVTLAVLAAGTYVAVWSVYGFRYAPSASAEWLLQAEDTAVVRERVPVLAAVAGWVDAQRLLPNVFTQGFVLAQATSETFPAYLAGEISEKSLWYYFPAAFLLKTPSVLLVLGGAGLLFFLGRRRSFGLANEVFVVLPIFVYLAFAMASGINIGVRHILPIYPFVLLIAAAAAKELLSWRRPVGRLVLVGMMAFWLVMFARVYPHTLTFFNVFAGGPENGLAWLAESNLDWGQDLKLLSSWMRREKVEHINLAYFGTADPEYYAMRCTHLPGAPFFAGSKIARPVLPGYVAISETLLSGLYLTPEWRLFYAPFHQRETVARIGNSIRVYWVDQWPELLPAVHDPKLEVSLADALAFGLNWPDHAILHYRSVLDRGPADASVAGKLAVALLQSGKTDEAVDMFRQAIALNPGDGESHRSLAVVLLERRDLQTAETHARAAVQLLPKDAAAHDVLGLALVGTGQLEAAEAAFVEALRLVPNYEEARGHLQILRDWRRRQSRS